MKHSKNTAIKSYQLDSGETRYQFQIYIGVNPLTGKEQRTTRRGFKTKKEAQLALAKIRLELANGTYKKTTAETYKDVYDLWIIQYQKTVEDSTFNKTLGYFRNHILPAMADYKIQKINVEVCQLHVNEWHSKLKKYRTIKAYAAKVLQFAVKRGYIEKNPFNLVDMPATKSENANNKSENFYTKEQLNHFLNCLEQEPNYKAFILFRLLAYSGMRKGEALALTWNDIDFSENEIIISKALARGSDNNLYVKRTKTGPIRVIKMDEKTMNHLHAWQKKQAQDYLILGYDTNKYDQLVFSNRKNEFLQPSKTQKWISTVQKKYNLPKVTTHGLRHTHCSLLFEAGASLKDVQDRLGHNDVQTTLNIYTHITQQAKAETIDKFSKYLEE